MARIGIAGAGLLGRLLAWQLSPDHEVTVFDPANGPEARSDGLGPAAFTAAGMLSPLAELDNSGPAIAALGWRSMALWREITDALARAGSPRVGALPAACGSCTGCSTNPGTGEEAALQLRTLGSLLVAHGSDLGAAQRVLARLAQAPDLAGVVQTPQRLDLGALAALEPAIDPRLHAWLLPGEGQILPLQVLPALCAAARGVRWRWRHTVASVGAGRIALDDGGEERFDLAIDVRGTGARPELPVRGVRGEVVWLQAPGVPLHRPVRLLHPRHRVYIVPRPCDHIVIGASEIESEDRSPVSLRSAVELMAAAQSVLPELAEARIVHLETNLRPALPDNEPRIDHQDGLLRINGLYRHGWLLAPALVEDALRQCFSPVTTC
ncbi:FAD-dependent oxidoreductase [Hydrogenophaga pseudoflava]|jgi:glycine oxidase|uniref:FAD-dependent oxidoreductase n=1 Tax=Hydrogenophaga pseudoflava TaxID=47421 RepID=UPI0008249347|nr:FAD-dependent oxidoreductase [Hydrogenophaga pseudoflava]